MKIIVIGGGPAGMMAAYAASTQNNQVVLVEKNEKLGKKLFITGKGRCNVTNAADMDVIFKNINCNSKFMFSALYDFDNTAVMSFFEENGCPLKTERGDRVFPVSDHSSDVIKALERALRNAGIRIILNTTVTDILTKESSVTGVIYNNGRIESADRVIVATGGISYPLTGSTGDGYRFAQKAGHNIIPQRASLVPLNIKEEWCKFLQGLSLKNVELRLSDGKRDYFCEQGEMLFTHFGISGPLVLSASSAYDLAKQKGKEINAYLDLKPALSFEQLDKRVLRDFEEVQNKQFKNSLDKLLPQKLIPIIVKLSDINTDKQVNEVTKEERKRLVDLLKCLPMTILGTGSINEAIVTRGGVDVREINPSTMESKLIKGLFFAGEVMDIDAMTGGFNLQLAWSTGHLAGIMADRKE